jgi:hypothetical protein
MLWENNASKSIHGCPALRLFRRFGKVVFPSAGPGFSKRESAMQKRVKLSQIKPNPFRNLKKYPYKRDKIDALKESIDATEFWPTIVVRQVGNKFELAFGHHRLKAAQEAGLKTIPVNVENLDNEKMYQMMCRENLDEYRTSAWVELENVRSGIEGIASGELTPDKVPNMPEIPERTKKAALRYAPSVIAGDDADDSRHHPYTAVQIAVMAGMTSKRSGGGVQPNQACSNAFQALELIERGLLDESILESLSRDQMGEMVRQQFAILRSNQRAAEVASKDAEAERLLAEEAANARTRQKHERRAQQKERESKQHERDAKANTKSFAKQAAKAMQDGSGVRDVREMAESQKASQSAQQRKTSINVDKLGEKIALAAQKIANDDSLSAWVPVFVDNSGEASTRSLGVVDRALGAAINRLEKLRKSVSKKVGV